ncbi:MAG: hypothetical protein M3N51_06350, partial [Actinomycetota bacterium]|nr:hypothetical protein [Actinomycetota bacterium]
LFGSSSGALLAFAAILFSPWGFYVSLSGHSEGLYYLAVALTVWGLAAHLREGSLAPLFLGAAGVAAGSLLRYEGWWLALAWAVIVGWSARQRKRSSVLLAAVAPLAAPLWWMALNLVRTGDPLSFAKQTAGYFEGGFGAAVAADPLLRMVFNPLTVLQAAPLLLVAVGVAAAMAIRSHSIVRPLLGLVGLQFLLLYLTSLVYPAFGDLAQRYLFALVLGLSPLLGALPGILQRLIHRSRIRHLVAVGALVLAGTVTAYRMADRPLEWAQAPDLLELNETLGEFTVGRDRPLRVALGPGMERHQAALEVQNGRRVEVVEHDGAQIDLLVERLPERTLSSSEDARAVIGRFHLFGPAASRLPVEAPCCGEGWVRRDERGVQSPLQPSPYLALEFTTDDPLPGHVAALERTLERRAQPVHGAVELRWLFGRGVSRGRVAVEVSLDEEMLFRTDIGARSRWVRVPFEVPPGAGSSLLRMAVVALPDIEAGWGWGRQSTVLVRELELAPLPLP